MRVRGRKRGGGVLYTRNLYQVQRDIHASEEESFSREIVATDYESYYDVLPYRILNAIYSSTSAVRTSSPIFRVE